MTRDSFVTPDDGPPSVLYVGDPDRGHDIARTLDSRHGFRLSVVGDVTEARTALSFDDDVECVVSEADLPDGDALDLLAVLRDECALPYVCYDDLTTAPVVDVLGTADAAAVHRPVDTEDRGLLAAQIDQLVRESRTERELRLKSRALDQADIGISIADMTQEDEPLVYVNQGFVDLTGYGREETLGRNCRFLQGEDTDEEPVARIREALEADESASVELLNYRKDGTPFWNQLDVMPVEQGGEVTHYLGFQRDVTERKTAKEGLQRQNDRLEEFASVVSHDLRNPLGLALGYVEAVQEEYEDDRLADAADALGRIDDIVDDVLTLARGGQSVEDLETVTLATTAEAAWEGVGGDVDTSGATLSLPSTPLAVRADESRLHRVFTNLFRNAVEHGGPEVTVTVGPREDGRGFFVADDGPGIPAEDRETVFERGYTTDPEGTGFGLPIVRTIAEAHGWTVTLGESEDGGARFEFGGVDLAD